VLLDHAVVTGRGAGWAGRPVHHVLQGAQVVDHHRDLIEASGREGAGREGGRGSREGAGRGNTDVVTAAKADISELILLQRTRADRVWVSKFFSFSFLKKALFLL